MSRVQTEAVRALWVIMATAFIGAPALLGALNGRWYLIPSCWGLGAVAVNLVIFEQRYRNGMKPPSSKLFLKGALLSLGLGLLSLAALTYTPLYRRIGL